MKIIYPLTVFADKYGGLYSRARYLAFNMEEQEIPRDIFGSETENLKFWAFHRNLYKIGGGDTPEEAVENLLQNLKKTAQKNLGLKKMLHVIDVIYKKL